LRAAVAEARRDPALALYLIALALVPFKWLSPLSYPQAGPTDLFVAAAFAAWVLQRVWRRERLRIRAVHMAYAGFVAATLLAAALASNHRLAAENVLITCELVALALMTSAVWATPVGRRAISWVVIASIVFTAALALVALALFYAGVDTSLTEAYSGYFRASNLYTRVAAGFESPPLMGSWCIFASAVVAMDVLGLARRVRLVLQVTLGVLSLVTLSRAFIGFVVALGLRTWRGADAGAKRAAAAVVAIGVVAMVALTVAPLSLSPLRPASSHEDKNPRLATIETSARTFWHHPIVGEGPGTLTAKWQDSPYRAHFTPLNVAATSGLPALLALGAVVVVLWRGRRRATSLVVWSGLAGLGLDALTQDAEHFRHVWIMFGIADAERRETDS
jgi:hypothetical protein